MILSIDPSQLTELHAQLDKTVRGDVRFDRLYRTLYATDASIYEIVPAGVVLPRNTDDVVAVVNACRAHGVPIVARGGGTGLTGGAVGWGVQLDFSQYMTNVEDVDPTNRTVRVGTGVVLDELNATLSKHDLFFAPDLSTSSRATLGGMIANNACGAHSIRYGRTVDHVAELTCVLSDGSVVRWPADAATTVLDAEVHEIVAGVEGDVRQRFPRVMRSNGGYALDRLLRDDNRLGVGTLLCGSEGTLGLVVDATLRLEPVPHLKGMVVVHFDDLFAALDATPQMLEHQPCAVELVDRMIIDSALHDQSIKDRLGFISPQSRALMVVEWFADDVQELHERIEGFVAGMERAKIGFLHQRMLEAGEQHVVWEMRKRGLGLLMSRPGDTQPYAFVEDSAVPAENLGDYIRAFARILDEEGVPDASYYAHASVGVIHVRPALNLTTARDVSRMQSIADRVSDLAMRFGGTMTGEHGDGFLRSCWLEKLYGRSIVDAFRRVKHAFDPHGLMNPGKIVDPQPMTEHLRYGPEHHTTEFKTELDLAPHSGLANLGQMCSGVGQCRQRLVGTMCPSYMATGDELHTTRGRANALRSALSNRGLLSGLDDEALDDVMDLCLSCKACKTECPTGVDMARIKGEWLSRRNRVRGMSRGDRAAAYAPQLASIASRAPRLANAVMGSRLSRWFAERALGFDRRIAPPTLARQTFRRWWRARNGRESMDAGLRRPIVYFLDTWANHYTPNVAMAAVRVLEAADFDVIVPELVCCGRTLISKGLLSEARVQAAENIRRLRPFVDAGVRIVGSEPSCLLTLMDEYPALVPTDDAKALASAAEMIEATVLRATRDDDSSFSFAGEPLDLLLHGHCHQKAMVGTNAAVDVLSLPSGYSVREFNSGCCGMAGSFGHEQAHYDVAKAIGEQRLFPAVRSRGQSEIAVWGFSCACQIAHHTNVRPRHGIEWLADALSQDAQRSIRSRRVGLWRA